MEKRLLHSCEGLFFELKEMKNYIFIVIIILVISGCVDKKSNNANSSFSTEEDSIAVQERYDSIIDIQTKAARDSAYRCSEEYRYAMENYHRTISEHTVGMSHISQMLCEYETVINSMRQAGKYAASHPEQMKNRVMQEKMRQRGQEALKLYDQLKDMKMTDAEKKRFDELNKK